MNNKENILIDNDPQQELEEATLPESEEIGAEPEVDESQSDESESDTGKSKGAKKKKGKEKSDESPLPNEIKGKDIELLQYYLGNRELEPFDNSDILRCRLLYQLKSTRKSYYTHILNKDTKKKIGTVSRMQLRHSWRMAHSKDAKKVVKNDLFFMTHQEWEDDLLALEKYIHRKLSADGTGRGARSTIYFSDVWDLSEFEYESAGLKKPQQFMALLQTAILGEIEENRRTVAAWHKLRKYAFKVELEAAKGGIFSYEDAAKIRNALKIKYLNDIKKFNIYQLKNVSLDFDFEKIVKDINKAYKDDLARRKDRWYQVHPFVSAFISLAVVLYFGFTYKYQLIYDKLHTLIIMGLLTVCAVDVLAIVIGGIRGKKRRLVRPEYSYLTPGVKKSITTFALVGVFAILSVLVFYQRYDGFTESLYYRYLDDGTIAVAGLVNSQSVVEIPDTIEDMPVTEIDKYAFDKEEIRNITLPDTLKKIDKSAFKECTTLSTITLPSSVEEISKSAFSGSGLQTVYMPEGGKVSIADKAFIGCYNLTGIENSTVVSSVGKKAFSDCSKLASVTFGENLETIGKKAFYNCSSITYIYIPSTVQSMGSKAFYNCDSLTTLSIPYAGITAESSAKESISILVDFTYTRVGCVDVTLNSATPVGAEAFKNITWLKSITFDDSITEIALTAFEGATNLESIDMSAGITSIYDSMFENCEKLTSVTGMEGVTVIGNNAFKGCTSLNTIELPAATKIGSEAFSGCTAIGTIELPATTEIGANAFNGCSVLSSVSMPEVTKVGANAFQFCSSLTSIELPSVISVGERAFGGCEGINSVTLSDATTTLGDYAFVNCTGLTSVNLSNTSIRSLGKYVFNGCTELSSIMLPLDVTTISEGLFMGCTAFSGFNGISNLNQLVIRNIEKSAFENVSLNGESLVIPDTVSEIGSRAFASNYIGSLSVPKSVTSVGEGAFAVNYSISNVTVPFLGASRTSSANNGYTWFFGGAYVDNITITDMTTIYSSTFAGGASYVDTINLESSVTTIEKSAFENYGNITYLSLPESVTSIGESAFKGCTSLSSINIPSKVTSISKSTFENCRNLTIDFSSLKVKSIGESAFSGCSKIKGNIVFNSGLETIGASAFASCGTIESIKLPESIKTVDATAFGSSPKMIVYVPNATIEKKLADTFKSYKNVQIEVIE